MKAVHSPVFRLLAVLLSALLAVGCAVSGGAIKPALAANLPSEDDLIAHYLLTGDLQDATGKQAAATISGTGYSFESGILHLNGGAKSTGNYVALPTGLFDGRDSVSISFWAVNENAAGNYAAFFFGSTESLPVNYVLLNPANPSGYVKCVFTDSESASAPWNTEVGFASTSNAAGNSVAAQSGLTHYVIVLDGKSFQLYVNGAAAGSEVTLSRTVSDLGSNLVAYLAASSYADDLMAGSFADLRIYDVALSSGQVEGLYSMKDSILADQALATLSLQEGEIFTSLELPSACGGYDITWQSSNPSVLQNDGTVIRPAAEDGNQAVTLTASVTVGSTTKTKQFSFTVLAQSADPAADAALYLSLVSVPAYTNSFLSLPAATGNGDTISWTSSDSSILASDGTMTLSTDETKTVTLTAVLTYNGGTASSDYEVEVAGDRPYAAAAYATGTTDLDGSLHLSAVDTSGNVTELNSGNGLLYPDLSGVTENTNAAKAGDTGLYYTHFALARQADGSFLLALTTSAAPGVVELYTSADLITYTAASSLTLPQSAAGLYSLALFGGEMTLSWQGSDGEDYRTSLTNRETVSAAPLLVNASFAAPEDALASSQCTVYLTESEYQNLVDKLTVPANDGMEEISTITTSVGVAPTMPDSVIATYTDGSTQDMGVSWDLSTLDLSTSGTYTVTGTVQQTKYENPFIEYRADPYIVRDPEDGSYYFTASYATASGSNYEYITLRHADTIEGLQTAEDIVVGTGYIWAPEMHYIDGKWVMYYANSIKCCARVCDGDPMVASNWGSEVAMTTIPNYYNAASLDMTYFEVDGTGYLIWAEMGGYSTIKRSTLYMAKINPDDPTKITGDTIILTTPQYAWEMVNYQVNEGPSVLQANGKIYVSFSASGTGTEYCMGLVCADADSDLMDTASWTKTQYPVLTSENVPGEYGPGHNSFTYDEDGNAIFVYHARSNDTNSGNTLADSGRHARIKRVHFAADGTPILSMSYAEELSEENQTVTATVVVVEENACDYNEDGLMDVQDVMALAQATVGDTALPENKIGDLSGDGVVDVRDVMLLAQQVVSKES